MKRRIYIIATFAIMHALSSSQLVSAEEVIDQTKETPIIITVIDNDDGTGVDPLDPTDPTQKNLLLETVPKNYQFKTKLQGQTVTAAAKSQETLAVFNDRIKREWSVKAQVVDNQLRIVRSNEQLTVTSFKINQTELVGTGATGIVAQAATNKTAQNNTGVIKTAISDLSIVFNDLNRELIAGDALEGTISYKLYNTPNAQ
ncbi:hypothetical protein ABID30_001933 [Enterococcus rotai]|uniref:WxL domain-containing protein n=1 Tax=Enterococcus rotai TaxID=118060 RepID=A0A0U2NPZ6_9ENTE|nr:hypothetical protein [Enterococcus rotai]ALS36866.1 hypothetical protein ATZ35_06760 [Enterococcus rotai]